MTIVWTKDGTPYTHATKIPNREVWDFPMVAANHSWVVNVTRKLGRTRQTVVVTATVACDVCHKRLVGLKKRALVTDPCLCENPTFGGNSARVPWKMTPKSVELLAKPTPDNEMSSVVVDGTVDLIPHFGNHFEPFFTKRMKYTEYDFIVLWSTLCAEVGEIVLNPKQSWWTERDSCGWRD